MPERERDGRSSEYMGEPVLSSESGQENPGYELVTDFVTNDTFPTGAAPAFAANSLSLPHPLLSLSLRTSR